VRAGKREISVAYLEYNVHVLAKLRLKSSHQRAYSTASIASVCVCHLIDVCIQQSRKNQVNMSYNTECDACNCRFVNQQAIIRQMNAVDH